MAVLGFGVTWRKQHRPGIASNDNTMYVTTARSSADLTKPNQIRYTLASLKFKKQNDPTNSHTPSRIKTTHTRRTHTGMRPHAPGQQAGDHPVPADTERHNPSKVLTQRQAPHELSAHRAIGIAADEVESQMPMGGGVRGMDEG